MSRLFDVICLGYSAVDYLTVVPHLPDLDTKLEGVEFTRQGGGPAGTAAATAARLGARTAFIGHIGDDDFGDFMISEFEKDNVDVSHVARCPGSASQFSFIMVEQHTGKRTIVWTRSNMRPVDPEKLDRDFISSCKVLHIDRHEIPAALVAAKWVKQAGGVVSMDAGTYKANVLEILPLVDVLIGSHAFARDATGETDPMKCARVLLDNRRISGVTCGDQGSYFVTQTEEFHLPAFPVKVIDTTGAGDVFHGAFAYGLSQDWDTRRCATLASAVAALKCTKLGGRAGIPSLQEANEFIGNKLSVSTDN